MAVNTTSVARESTKSGSRAFLPRMMRISATGVVEYILAHKWLHFTLYVLAIAWFYLVGTMLHKWGLQ